MADDAAGGANGVDQAGATVQHRFKEFLTDFHPRSLNSTHGDGGFDASMMVETTDAELTSMQRATYDYVAQLAHMAQNNKTTLFVNFQHVVEKDAELAEAIEMEYYRFEPFLRQSIEALITEMKNQDGTAAAFSEGYGAKQEYAVSFYAMSRVERIRAMKTDKIGRLMSISGTVTRSSDVRYVSSCD
jgi:DNA replicative helicase MCM subunit Mcm2 (Cdc46/Mcm family)